ncbi:MAG: adenosylmethionine decarboxylase [Cyanobacteria bacterium NC_groundwater_1444_Ag_S-0.65um_54_12]|nr:adenosylmethionine decarboxylase [Cyanobacteria bacterium NC_groundwater_1444_Ag_S-0.65um_54_12]
MFGPHLMVDAYDCSRAKLEDLGLVASILDEFPTAIDMTKIMPPYVFRYSGEVPEDWGVSGIVLIAESHISIHTFPDKGFFSLDIFSCRPFDVDYATHYMVQEFEARKFDRQVVSRGREFPRSPGRATRILAEERGRVSLPFS